MIGILGLVSTPLNQRAQFLIILPNFLSSGLIEVQTRVATPIHNAMRVFTSGSCPISSGSVVVKALAENSVFQYLSFVLQGRHITGMSKGSEVPTGKKHPMVCLAIRGSSMVRGAIEWYPTYFMGTGRQHEQ